ncbi:MAG: alpha/beta fold hydrolase, partial [Asticcacaulis sp.]|nr:alpha/beta fold hydrolase [Asticcacaulis sp.]
MPKQILFVQGAGEAVHDQWDNRLVDSLRRELGDGYTFLYPPMPDEADPRYPDWRAALLKAFEGLEDGAILIGHSVGGTVLLHTLADAAPKFRPGALILIAPPFIGNGGWQSDDVPARSSFILPAGLPIRLYHGTEDADVPFGHSQLYAKAIRMWLSRLLRN